MRTTIPAVAGCLRCSARRASRLVCGRMRRSLWQGMSMLFLIAVPAAGPSPVIHSSHYGAIKLSTFGCVDREERCSAQRRKRGCKSRHIRHASYPFSFYGQMIWAVRYASRPFRESPRLPVLPQPCFRTPRVTPLNYWQQQTTGWQRFLYFWPGRRTRLVSPGAPGGRRLFTAADAEL